MQTGKAVLYLRSQKSNVLRYEGSFLARSWNLRNHRSRMSVGTTSLPPSAPQNDCMKLNRFSPTQSATRSARCPSGGGGSAARPPRRRRAWRGRGGSVRRRPPGAGGSRRGGLVRARRGTRRGGWRRAGSRRRRPSRRERRRRPGAGRRRRSAGRRRGRAWRGRAPRSWAPPARRRWRRAGSCGPGRRRRTWRRRRRRAGGGYGCCCLDRGARPYTWGEWRVLEAAGTFPNCRDIGVLHLLNIRPLFIF